MIPSLQCGLNVPRPWRSTLAVHSDGIFDYYIYFYILETCIYIFFFFFSIYIYFGLFYRHQLHLGDGYHSVALGYHATSLLLVLPFLLNGVKFTHTRTHTHIIYIETVGLNEL